MTESPRQKESKQAMATRMSTIIHRYSLHALLSIMASIISVSAFAGAPMPDIPKGKGEKCVEETQFMRESHMELLLHQRDDTLRRGIRTKKHSLKECIACHVVTDSDNQAVSVASPKHFCRECHDYAAVKVDCFECHASKPAKKSASIKGDSIKAQLGFGFAGLELVETDPAMAGDKL